MRILFSLDPAARAATDRQRGRDAGVRRTRCAAPGTTSRCSATGAYRHGSADGAGRRRRRRSPHRDARRRPAARGLDAACRRHAPAVLRREVRRPRLLRAASDDALARAAPTWSSSTTRRWAGSCPPAAGTCRWSTSPTTSSTRCTRSWPRTAACGRGRTGARRAGSGARGGDPRAGERDVDAERRRGRALARSRPGPRRASSTSPRSRCPDGPGTAVHDVVLLGGWHWRPNAAGLRWFVDEVAPHLEGAASRSSSAATPARRSWATGRACGRSGRCPTRWSSCRARGRRRALDGGRGRAGQDARRDRLRPARRRDVDRDARHRRAARDGAHRRRPGRVRRGDRARACADGLEQQAGEQARAWAAQRRRASGRRRRSAPRPRERHERAGLRLPGQPVPERHAHVRAGEVRALRAAGVRVETATVRRVPPDRGAVRRPTARSASGRGRSFPPRPLGLLRATAARSRRPRAYFATLWRALRLGARRRARAPVAALLLRRGDAAVGLDARARPCTTSTSTTPTSRPTSRCWRARTPTARARSRAWTWSITIHGPTELLDVEAHKLAAKVADASAVVCISDFARSQVAALADPATLAKVHTVRCGVDLSAFAPRSDRDRRRAAARSCASPRCRGARATSSCSRRSPSVLEQVPERAAHAGRRRRRAGVPRSAGGRARRRARRRVPRARSSTTGWRRSTRRADVFCLPSFAEGVPIVLMEAMAMEMPVVATEIMGVPELVERRGQRAARPARARRTCSRTRSSACWRTPSCGDGWGGGAAPRRGRLRRGDVGRAARARPRPADR